MIFRSTPNIKSSRLSILLYYFTARDYHFVVDFLIELFMREEFISIVWPEIRQLTIAQPELVKS